MKPTKKKEQSSSDSLENLDTGGVEIDLKDKAFLSKKSKKNNYDLNDKELKVIHISDDVTARLIANDNGYFVDIRKYYKGYPTKKGIRILATKFVTMADILKIDIEELFDAAQNR